MMKEEFVELKNVRFLNYICLICKLMDPRDYLCTDGVYGVYDEERHLKPHRKLPNVALSAQESAENDNITEFRGDIERKFGDLQNKFTIVKDVFRHGDLKFNYEAKLCCALSNAEMYGNKEAHDEDVDNHPFFSTPLYLLPFEIAALPVVPQSPNRLYGNNYQASCKFLLALLTKKLQMMKMS